MYMYNTDYRYTKLNRWITHRTQPAGQMRPLRLSMRLKNTYICNKHIYIYTIKNLQTHKTEPIRLKSTYMGYREYKYPELDWYIIYKNWSIRDMRPWDCSYVEMYICIIQNLQIHKTKPKCYTQNSTCGGHEAPKIVHHTEIYIYRIQSI